MNEWIESNKLIWSVIIGLVGFFGGGLCRFVYERFFSERAIPTEKLLAKFSENPNHLGQYGRKRLQNESMQALADWTKRCLPPNIGSKLDAWPDAELAIVAKNVLADVTGRALRPS